MDLDKLYQILESTTQMYRKGSVIKEDNIGDIRITTIDAMPSLEEAGRELDLIDCHFVTIGVDKAKAEEHKEVLKSILAEYPDPERLAGGPSYIEVGGVIGDQGAAFKLFALGSSLGLWRMITPKTMGFEGEEANHLAGMGFVMITGYNKEE